jgi:ABC-type iron transport system FetAB ATPase subunit
MSKTTKQEAARKLSETKPKALYLHEIERALDTSNKQRLRAKVIRELDVAIKDYRDVLVIIVEQ